MNVDPPARRAAAVNAPEPHPTRFDLRFRLGGAAVRVHPLFWAAAAVLGVRYYADPEGGNLGWFLFWMAAALASVLLHELGHVFVGRMFGMRGEVVLSGLGGLTLGIDSLPRRGQRLLVLLAGPLVNALVVAALWGMTCLPFPEALSDWASVVANGTLILLRVNGYWALLNLAPLWPLDGGRMACEIGEGLFGRRGVAAALILSLAFAGLLALSVMLEMRQRYAYPVGERYFLDQQRLSVLLFFCFLFWLRGFREWWAWGPSAARTTEGKQARG
jgi:Zn-dependent protease